MYGKVISMGNIYHYCSLDTFAQIIKNKTIRLSDLNKTNDYMEKKWGMKLLYRTLCDELQDRGIVMDLKEDYCRKGEDCWRVERRTGEIVENT